MKLDKLVEKDLNAIDAVINDIRNITEKMYLEKKEVHPFYSILFMTYDNLQHSLLSQTIDSTNCTKIYEYLVLTQCLGSLVREDTSKIKEKISECLILLKESDDFTKSVESYYEKYKANPIWEGNAVKEIDEFYSFFTTGHCDDKYYSFALYWLNFFVGDDKSLFNTSSIYNSIVSFAARYNQGRDKIEYEISGFIVSYYYEYCKQNSYEKRYFYTDEDSVNYRIESEQIYDSEGHIIKFRGRNFDMTYNWITLYVLCEGEEFERSLLLHQLFDKVYFNTRVVAGVIPEVGTKGYELPFDFINRFLSEYTSLEALPGVVIMLYMLCKELSESDFFRVFPLLESKELMEIRGQDWIDLSERNAFNSLLSDCIKKTGQSIAKAELNYEYIENQNSLLNGLFFFCMWENCSYTVVYDKSRIQLLDDFYCACVKHSWYKKETITSLLNTASRHYGFEKKDIFNSYDVDFNTSNELLLNLLYNLSRTEVEAESSLKKQITILRDIQLGKFPIDSFKGKNKRLSQDDIETLKSNQEELRDLDFGFKIPNLQTNIYPFCSDSFCMSFGGDFYLTREYICKFVCETDTQYRLENGGVYTDFRATNKLGLSTRYLFKDRNMAIHDSKHVSVQNLLEPKYVDNLLYFLGDAYMLLTTLLSKAKEKELEKETVVTTFLLNKTKKLYESVITKIYELLKEKEYRNISNNIELYEDTGATVKKIIVEEYNKNIPIIYDKKLLMGLEMYLNDMFAVNEKNEYGDDNNYNFMDFFRRYHSEIALYITYLTFAFKKA